MEHNNYSYLMEKNSICNGGKNIQYQNDQPKIRTLIPDSLKRSNSINRAK